MSTVTHLPRRPRLGIARRAWPRYAVLTLFAIPWVFLPLWMILVNSLKSEGEASTPGVSFPREWAALSNYATVFQEGDYPHALINSAIVAIPTIIVVLLLGSMAAWSYARSESRTLRFAYYATVISIVLPPAIIPTVFLLQQMHLNGERLGYMLVTVGARMGLVVFLATGFIKALPRETEEAAMVDGASHGQIYRNILLPLIAPVLFVGGVILVITIWNDFYFPLFLLQGPESQTLPLAMYQFATAGESRVLWNLVFAHVLLTSIPLMIVYFVLQRRVIGGLTEGGVKG